MRDRKKSISATEVTGNMIFTIFFLLDKANRKSTGVQILSR